MIPEGVVALSTGLDEADDTAICRSGGTGRRARFRKHRLYPDSGSVGWDRGFVFPAVTEITPVLASALANRWRFLTGGRSFIHPSRRKHLIGSSIPGYFERKRGAAARFASPFSTR